MVLYGILGNDYIKTERIKMKEWNMELGEYIKIIVLVTVAWLGLVLASLYCEGMI